MPGAGVVGAVCAEDWLAINVSATPAAAVENLNIRVETLLGGEIAVGCGKPLALHRSASDWAAPTVAGTYRELVLLRKSELRFFICGSATTRIAIQGDIRAEIRRARKVCAIFAHRYLATHPWSWRDQPGKTVGDAVLLPATLG